MPGQLPAPGESGIIRGRLVTANTDIVLADAGRYIECDHATNTIAVNIQNDAGANLPVGCYVEICRIGAGLVVITFAGGVTLRTPNSMVSLRVQNSSIVLRKRAANDWVGAGDLT